MSAESSSKQATVLTGRRLQKFYRAKTSSNGVHFCVVVHGARQESCEHDGVNATLRTLQLRNDVNDTAANTNTPPGIMKTKSSTLTLNESGSAEISKLKGASGQTEETNGNTRKTGGKTECYR